VKISRVVFAYNLVNKQTNKQTKWKHNRCWRWLLLQDGWAHSPSFALSSLVMMAQRRLVSYNYRLNSGRKPRHCSDDFRLCSLTPPTDCCVACRLLSTECVCRAQRAVRLSMIEDGRTCNAHHQHSALITTLSLYRVGGPNKSAHWRRSWYKALKKYFLNILLTCIFSSAYWRHQWRRWPVFFRRYCSFMRNFVTMGRHNVSLIAPLVSGVTGSSASSSSKEDTLNTWYEDCRRLWM